MASCKRLGTVRVGRIQRLLVTVETVEQATAVTDAAKKLRHSPNSEIRDKIFINPDLTLAEQRAAYEVRCRRRQASQRVEKTAVDRDCTTGRLVAAPSGGVSNSVPGRMVSVADSFVHTAAPIAGNSGSGSEVTTSGFSLSADRSQGLSAAAPVFWPASSTLLGSSSTAQLPVHQPAGNPTVQSAPAHSFDSFGASSAVTVGGQQVSTGDGRHLSGALS